MDTLVKDVRYALATARRGMAFALAAVLTLALGVGATTAVFSVIDGVLLRPLPYPSPDRLVRLYEEYPGAAGPLRDRLLSNLTFYAWVDRGSQPWLDSPRASAMAATVCAMSLHELDVDALVAAF